MNKLQKTFEGNNIRIVQRHGDAWFVAADVCGALKLGNTTMAMQRLDDDETTLITIEGRYREREVNAVNEPGLYALIMRSRKPAAKRFDRWVRHEVLPELRKNGRYHMQSSRDGDILDVAGALLQGLKEEREARRRIEAKQQAADTEREQLKNQMQNRQLAADIGERSWESMRKEAVRIVRRRGGGPYADRWHAVYNRVATETGIDLPSKYPKSRRGSRSILKCTTRNEAFFVLKAARAVMF